MKVLVTGGSGFIGAHAVRLLGPHHKVLAPGRSELDLLDAPATASYLREHRPDVVLHAATWNATRTSDKDLSRVLEHNLRMHVHLMDAKAHFGRLISYGSGAEYDRRRWREGLSEGDFGQSIPVDDYGLSKYLIERSRDLDGQTCNLRLFGVFGPGEDWRIRFLSQVCCWARHDQPIQIRQDRLFDFTWVEDVIHVTRIILEGNTLPHTVNLTAGSPSRLSELARQVLAVAGKDLPIHVMDPEPGQAYTADTRLLRSLLPGIAFTPIQESLRQLYDFYLQHPSLADPAGLF